MSEASRPGWQVEVPDDTGFWELRDDRHGVHAFVQIVRCPHGTLFLKPPRGRPGLFALSRWQTDAFRWTRWRKLEVPDHLPAADAPTTDASRPEEQGQA